MFKGKVCVCHLFYILSILPLLLAGQAQKILIDKDRFPGQIEHHEVTVSLKLVQVSVFDRDMRPVTNLELGDFEVFDNGKPVGITAIEKPVDLSNEDRERTFQNPLPKRSSSAVNRKFILFFDFAFNDDAGIVQSKDVALQFIRENIRFPDEVCVLSYHAKRGVTVHEYLTTDYERIQGIIGGFGLRETFGRAEQLKDIYADSIEKQYPADLEGTFLGKELTGKEISDTLNKNTQKSQEEAYKHDISMFCAELGRIGKALSSINGKKNVIFFSKGISDLILYGRRLPVPGLFDHEELFGSAAMRGFFDTMIKKLSDSNCMIFAINVGKPESRFGAFNIGMQGDKSLRELSKGTGGEYFGFLEDRSKIVKKIQNLTQFYYVLFFPIKENWDGKFHRLEVKLKNKKGYRVFSSAGYFNPKPFSEYDETERLLHLIDLALGENPHFQVPLSLPAAVFPCLVPQSRVLLLISVQGDQVYALEAKRLEAVILLFDKMKQLIGYERREFNTTQFGGRPLFFSSTAALPSGAYEYRMVLRNLETGRGAVNSIPFTVIEVPNADLVLSSPLLLTARSDHLFIELSSEFRDKKRNLVLKDIYPFDMTEYAPLLEPIDVETRRIFAMIRCAPSKGMPQDMRWTVQILGPTKTVSTAPQILDVKTDELGAAFLLLISLENLEPGTNSLRFIGENIQLGLRSEVSAVFSVNFGQKR